MMENSGVHGKVIIGHYFTVVYNIILLTDLHKYAKLANNLLVTS